MRNFELELQNIETQIRLLINQKRKIAEEFKNNCKHSKIYKGAGGWFACLKCDKRFQYKDMVSEKLLNNVTNP